MIFKEQIEKRREQEKKTLWEAFENLAYAVGSPKRDIHGTQSDHGVFKNILFSLGINDFELNPTDGDVREQFEEILRQNNVMYRKISLERDWWKHSAGSILARLKSGEFIALLPGRWNGYYYKAPDSGQKIWINKKEYEKIQLEAYCFYPPLPSRKLNNRDILKFTNQLIEISDWATVCIA